MLQMNVREIQIAPSTKHAYPRSVLTHASQLNVVRMLTARSTTTTQNVCAGKDCREIPTSAASRLTVGETRTVGTEKFATWQSRNVSPCARAADVPRVRGARPEIIGRPAHATRPFRAMDLPSAHHVRIKTSGIFVFCFWKLNWVFCHHAAIITDDPECRVDQDCAPQLACDGERCYDPCRQNPCSADQKCTVLDSFPTRSVACECPRGTYVDENGRCVTGKSDSNTNLQAGPACFLRRKGIISCAVWEISFCYVACTPSTFD